MILAQRVHVSQGGHLRDESMELKGWGGVGGGGAKCRYT